MKEVVVVIGPGSICPAKRPGTPDEVANVAALLMGPDGGFITGSDFRGKPAPRRR
jgi:hypothetical protein